jgi:hypothetical protein
MQAIAGLTAKDILQIQEPGGLFSGRVTTLRQEYMELARRWHPDRCGILESDKVMAHINELYRQGKVLLAKGRWIANNYARFTEINGSSIEVGFRKIHDFELGKMYIGDRQVLFLIKAKHRDLWVNARKIPTMFAYANCNMKAEVEQYLPKVTASFETIDDHLGLVIAKAPDMLLLRDVLRYYHGTMPHYHVAWILSTLYNLIAYLDYARLSHNALSPDTYFIRPQAHAGALLGGWWYAVSQGARMRGVPANSFAILPPQVKAEKRGSILTDLEAIRAIGRELLGDRNGTRLMDLEGVPQPLLNWLRGAPDSDAVTDYARWQEVILVSYGMRRYRELSLTAGDVYG